MDRRRINGPPGGTSVPVYSNLDDDGAADTRRRPKRTRTPGAQRKMFLKTGVTPSASGSAYLEFSIPKTPLKEVVPGLSSLLTSGLKLTCTVHGPRPLPRSAPFSPHIILTTHVKFAPFATRKRRGYLRDATERDLSVHLETALRGVIIGDRWPKSGMEVIITILEGEEDYWWGDCLRQGATTVDDWGMMSVLSGCITVASAAIADAGIDCLDVVAGGIAAIVEDEPNLPTLVLDPVPSEHQNILAACVVAYFPSQDEITDLWAKGEMGFENSNLCRGISFEDLMDNAVQAALGSHRVLVASLKETAETKKNRI
ncbi:BgTH12-04716 [Blumeria graminis f. sp. triticale]|uniref:BgTH12-04716 n=1 Tax=Blumeria graminis f. sp. triticale TaxID=1689686 RepID=A0A9W4DC09_BLUGR|nr:BgTH12-04716 [Blumeria graminis f. sp. triticale]